MSAQINRQYQLAQRPGRCRHGRDTFSYVETPLGEPARGQILVKNEYLSLDPAMRGWMNDAQSYIPPVGIGEVMRALGVGKVLASQHPGFQVGDDVNGALGVQDYFLGEPKGFYKVDPSRAPLPLYLSALGMTGMTAYFALLDVGQPKAGETVVVSGAAGAVGSVVGQIAKLKGCRVVGIAGGAEKCRFLVEELGFDGAIDYKNEDLTAGLKRECPKGVNVFFDNVGGEILDAVLARLRLQGADRPLRGDQPVQQQGSGARPGQLPVPAGQPRAHGRHGGDGLRPALPGRPQGDGHLAGGRQAEIEGGHRRRPGDLPRNAAQAVQRGKLRQVGVEGLRSAPQPQSPSLPLAGESWGEG